MIVGSEALQRADGAAVMSLVQQIADTAKAQVTLAQTVLRIQSRTLSSDPDPLSSVIFKDSDPDRSQKILDPPYGSKNIFVKIKRRLYRYRYLPWTDV